MNALHVLHEIVKELELGRAQSEILIFKGNTVRIRVQYQVANRHNVT